MKTGLENTTYNANRQNVFFRIVRSDSEKTSRPSRLGGSIILNPHVGHLASYLRINCHFSG